MAIEISYNAHGANLVLYAIILDKSLQIYNPSTNSFIDSSDITAGVIPLSEGVFNSYSSSVDSTNFVTAAYVIRVYQMSGDVSDAAIDNLLHVSEFNWDSQLQREVDSLDSTYYLPEFLSYDVDQVYIVNVVPVLEGSTLLNVFQINDKPQPKIKLKRGNVYRFDQSHVSNGDRGYSEQHHPLRFSTSPDGTHNGGIEYGDGIEYATSPGNVRSYTIFEVPATAPSRLYYYCHNHPNMGGIINIVGGNINDFGNNTIEVVTTRGSSDSNEVKIITR